jgi:hypothetical protein
MTRIAALAVALFAVLPAAVAQAGPCQPGQQHPTLRAVFEDLSLNEVLPGPPTVYAGHRIGIDARFDNATQVGVIAGSVKISAPDVPTTTQKAGYKLAIIPQAAGTIPVTFTWTETQNPGAADPVASCDGSAVVTMTVRESKPATIKLRTTRPAGKPRVDLRLALGFTADGDASPITLRARAVSGSTPPRTGLKRIAALKIDTVSKGLHRRIGSGSFGVAELFYSASEGGGAATLRWSGPRKPASRGALSVDLLQRGAVIARLRTGIECGTRLPGRGGRYSCRARGLTLTKP